MKFKVKIIKVLDYYDGPLIYSFEELGKTRLAYFANDAIKDGKWLCSKYLLFDTSESDLVALEEGKISIREFMNKSKNIELISLGPELKIIDRSFKKFDEILMYVPEEGVTLG